MKYLREKIIRNWSPAHYLVVALTLVSSTPATAQPVPLSGSEIPQFVDPLPLLAVAGGAIETITSASATLSMCEFKANVMPSTFVPASSASAYAGTYVWGYRNGSTCPESGTPFSTYVGPVVVATRGTPTEIQYINSLPHTAASQLSAWKTSTDQTLDWADPLNGEANRGNGREAAMARNRLPFQRRAWRLDIAPIGRRGVMVTGWLRLPSKMTVGPDRA